MVRLGKNEKKILSELKSFPYDTSVKAISKKTKIKRDYARESANRLFKKGLIDKRKFKGRNVYRLKVSKKLVKKVKPTKQKKLSEFKEEKIKIR